jgi:hypothetical protein
VYYEEPDLSGGVKGIDYTISYGTDEGLEEGADDGVVMNSARELVGV